MEKLNLDRFSRVTSSQRFIPEIDGLRFIAISTVVLYHLRTSILRSGAFDESTLTGSLFFDVLSKGGLGVNIFFTISGFILALPFARMYMKNEKKVDVKKYYLRRLTRLEPPYIIIMTVFFIIQLILFRPDFIEQLYHYFASLLYLHFFIYGAWSTINPVAWSLETEVQFYILAPVIAMIFSISNNRFRYSLYLVVIVFYAGFVVYNTNALAQLHLAKSVIYYFLNFFLGFVLADLFLVFNIQKQDKRKWFGDLLGVLGLVGIFYFYYKPSVTSHLYFYLSTILLFYGTFCGKILNYILTRKIITVIGGMCYTIYLIHYIFIFGLNSFLFNLIPDSIIRNFYLSFGFEFFVVIPLLLILSGITFLYIEKPFMYSDWFNRFKVHFQKK